MVEIINHYFLYDNKVGYQVKTPLKVDTNRGLSLKSPPAPPHKKHDLGGAGGVCTP